MVKLLYEAKRVRPTTLAAAMTEKARAEWGAVWWLGPKGGGPKSNATAAGVFWGHEKGGNGRAWCSAAAEPLSPDASHRWRRNSKVTLAALAPYETPPLRQRADERQHYPIGGAVVSRGNFQGLSATEQDVELLQTIVRIVRRVDNATVAPHPSVLHSAYREIEETRAAFGDCSESEWLLTMLQETQAPSARKRIGGALSATQYRGTGEYWGVLWRAVKRRLAEKALCAVRDLQELRSAMLKQHSCSVDARATQKQRLRSLARILSLDEDIAVGFMTNGYDAANQEFVRCPDLDEARKFLQALGAPLNSVPRPVRPRQRGEKFQIDL